MSSRLLLASLAVGGATLARAQAPDYGRQLAAVHSVREAQALLDTVTHRSITLDSLATRQQELCFSYQIHSDSIDQESYSPCSRYRIGKTTAWQQADFNQDGRPDLFVADDDGNAYCLLNRGQLLPELLSLTRRVYNRRACQQYTVTYLGNRPAVVHFYLTYQNPSS